MEIVSKLQDAAAMFWLNLDEHERRVVLYTVAYVLVSVALALQKASSERRRQRLLTELREELGVGAHR